MFSSPKSSVRTVRLHPAYTHSRTPLRSFRSLKQAESLKKKRKKGPLFDWFLLKVAVRGTFGYRQHPTAASTKTNKQKEKKKTNKLGQLTAVGV